jgi:hypothetical protein
MENEVPNSLAEGSPMHTSPAFRMPDPPGPASEVYAIIVEGVLDASWSDWLAGFTITPQENGATLLAGTVADQAALHGLLARIRDMNLKLIRVERTGSGHDGY